MNAAVTIVYVGLAALLFWTAFCRLVWVDRETRWQIRLAFWAIGVACAFAVFSVLFWGHRPTWPDTVLLAAFVGMQLVTSKLWRTGVPRQFQKDST